MTDQAPVRGERPVAREGLSFRRLPGATRTPRVASGFLERLERGFMIASVVVFLGISTLGRSGDPASLGEEHNFLNTFLYGLVLAGVLPLLLFHRRQIVPVIANSKLIWLFLAWAIASVAWSVDPQLAVRRLILFSVPVLVALYAAARFETTTAIKLVGWGYFWTIAVSAAVAILLPSVGVMHDSFATRKWAALTGAATLEGNWCGVLGHKNVLGFATIANMQIFAWRWYIEKEKRWLHAAIILFSLFVTYKTHSATSELVVGLTLATYFIIHVSRKAARVRALIVFAVVLVGAAVTVAAVSLPEEFTALVGKDATLTGRVPIWNVVVREVIPTRPIFGYGFNTFFVPNNPIYLQMVDIVGWPAPHAHDGYLNLAVELGIPGALLGTFILLRMLFGAMRLANDDRAPWALYMLAFGVTFAVLNIVEANLLRMNDNWTFALLFCCFALWKYQAESRPTAVPAERRWGAFTSIKHTELP